MTIWTSLAAETTLIGTLEATGRLATTQVGTSAGGTPILLWRIGGDTSGPPEITSRAVLCYVGEQHGNEPAGREALLALADYLCSTVDADETTFLDTYGVLMIPTANPDGLASSRFNSAGQDINRWHLTHDAPEAVAIAGALSAAAPLLLVDHHEFGSGFAPEDVLFAEPRHPATAAGIVASSNLVIDALGSRAATDGYTFAAYPQTGAGESTAQRLVANAGLRHCTSVLIESRRTADDDAGQQDRVDLHYAMAEELLAYAIANADALLDTAGDAAASKAAEGAAGAVAFQLGGGATVDPPPLAYDLTDPQLSATVDARSSFGIVDDGAGRVAMGQPAQPVIPLLLDHESTLALVSATRVFDLGPGGDGSGLDQVGQAKIRTRMVWLGCDLVSGGVIAELHDITGSVSRLIGAHTSAALTVPIPIDTTGRAPLATVLQATAPAQSLIVAVVNDLPIWGGIPLPRERGTDATMQLGCVTIEGYLDRRYVGDHNLVSVDESAIFSALISEANVEGIGLTVDAPLTGRIRTRRYRDFDDATVYQRLQELSAVRNGPEWTIDLDWADADMNRIVKIARMRGRLGVAAAPPSAVFRATAGSTFSSEGGSDATYTYVEDLTDGRYANHVLAVGSGEGEDRAQGAVARDTAALDAGRPRWELRYRPSTSITDVSRLTDHGEAELDRRRNGALSWKISATWNQWPRYGVDWRLGDDIAWELVGHGHPQGVTGQGRAVGVEIDPQAGTLSPILLDGQV